MRGDSSYQLGEVAGYKLLQQGPLESGLRRDRLRLLALVLASSPPRRRLPLRLTISPGTIEPRRGSVRVMGWRERERRRSPLSFARKKRGVPDRRFWRRRVLVGLVTRGSVRIASPHIWFGRVTLEGVGCVSSNRRRVPVPPSPQAACCISTSSLVIGCSFSAAAPIAMAFTPCAHCA